MKPTSTADIDACAREPIRIPGNIQPHGILLVLNGAGTLLQASANAGALFKVSCQEALGRPWREVLADEGLSALEGMTRVAPETGNVRIGSFIRGGRSYSVMISRSAGLTLLEFEDGGVDDNASLDTIYPLIRDFLAVLQSQPSEQALNTLAAEQVRELTQFDRVLIYKFDKAWNGTVVAEDRNDRLPSYFDLRFPASDIPAQARELYRVNRLRIIPDADYTPVPILPALNPETGAPVDLGFSALRSVSSVHLEYMRNMGTPASMSISIIVGNALWGLISCHNATPKRVPEHVRAACDLIGQVLALQLAARARESDSSQMIARQCIQTSLLATMAAEENFIDGLTRHPEKLMALADADGTAILLDGSCMIAGHTPPRERIIGIGEWLAAEHDGVAVFSSQSLPSVMPGSADFAAEASGLLAIPVSQVHKSYIMWFRREVIHTVKWGGDPRKAVVNTSIGMRLHPRNSFETWKETVRLTSAPWSPVDIESAASFRNAIISIVMRKAEELAQLADDLKRSNKELEAFSYSISHDLRAPFRHIVGYAELLKDSELLKKDERSRRYVSTIIESALSAGKLVDDLLGFSRIGRTALTNTRVDMNQLMREARHALWPDTRERQIDWRIGDLSPAWGDPNLLRQVFLNLLSNALKYTRPRAVAEISVTSEAGEGETVYTVRDNGVGFEMDYVGKLFGVFQRLHRMEEFEGTGIGLANVRRIVERHGGRTWAEGKPGEGAAFHFSLPDHSEARNV